MTVETMSDRHQSRLSSPCPYCVHASWFHIRRYTHVLARFTSAETSLPSQSTETIGVAERSKGYRANRIQCSLGARGDRRVRRGAGRVGPGLGWRCFGRDGTKVKLSSHRGGAAMRCTIHFSLCPPPEAGMAVSMQQQCISNLPEVDNTVSTFALMEGRTATPDWPNACTSAAAIYSLHRVSGSRLLAPSSGRPNKCATTTSSRA